jgi:hypothetical protein
MSVIQLRREPIVLLAFVFFAAGNAFAQTNTTAGKWYNSYASGFDTRSVFINIAPGLPSGDYDEWQIPPITASIDWKFPFVKTVLITIGLQGGYHYGKNNGLKYRHIPIAGRVAYHFNFIKTLDVYFLGSIGYTFEQEGGGDFLSKEKGGGLLACGGAGIRWLPAGIPVGIYAEFNYNALFYGTAGLVITL